MNFYNGIKKIFLFATIAIALLFFSNKTVASDYQYKILDPKYNPAAEKLINGELQTLEPTQPISENEGFNILRFLAIFAAISFPVFVLSFAWKSFQSLMNTVPGCNIENSQNQSLGNIKITPKTENEESKISYNLSQIFDNQVAHIDGEEFSKEIFIENNIEETEKQTQENQETVETIKQTPSISESMITEKIIGSINSHLEKTAVATIPIEKKNPMLLNTAPLTKNKGFCLVEYDKKYSLIGYIDTKVFFLNQFDAIKSTEIRPRLTERNEGKDRYLVRLGSYKGLIEVSNEEMNLLINL